MTSESEPAVDRRVLRGVRNREAVIEAFLDIITEGDLAPTAQKVAERAQLSLRSVFHHFADMEQLFASAADLHVVRYTALLQAVSTTGPLTARIDEFVEQRATLLEQILPVYRAALLVAHKSETIQARFERGDHLLREQIVHVFESELAGAGDLDWRLDAIDAAASLDGWVRLRTRQALSIRRAKTVLAATLNALLAQ